MTFKEEWHDFVRFLKERLKKEARFLFNTFKWAGLLFLAVTLAGSMLGYIFWATFSLTQLGASILGVYVPTFGILAMQDAPWINYLVIPLLSLSAGMVAMTLFVWSRLFAFVTQSQH